MSENIIKYVIDAGNGDTDAMAKLYSRTLKASYFLANTLSAGDGSAKEITEKAYARAFRTIDKLKKPEAFEIWMKQNVALTYKDTQKFVFGDAEAGTAEVSFDFLPESVLDDEEMSSKIIEAIYALKPVLRTAVVLHYNNGMPVQALAKFLGVSESTANALISKARTEILNYCSLEAAAPEQTKSLPVLTRILQRKAVETAIDNADVRDIFIYAIDEYEASKPAVIPAEEPAKDAPDAEEPAEEKAAEPDVKAEEPAEAPEETKEPEKVAEEPTIVASNVIDFKQKINEILDSENIPSNEEKTVDINSHSDEEKADEADVPAFVSTQPAVSEATLDNFAEKPHTPKPEPKNPKFKINPKLIGIVCAVLVVVIIIAVAVGGKDKPDTSKTTNSENANPSVTQAAEVSADGYKWVAGGFEECTELTYLNENYMIFKSAKTDKYGLLDYQGNIVLQPHFAGFRSCSDGRDYSQRNNYHVLVMFEDGQEYELVVNNGVAEPSSTPHVDHRYNDTDKLPDDVAYDERDRYFEGYAAARKDDKWGYVSLDGDKKVIKYEYETVNDLVFTAYQAYDYCRPVTNGLIPVKKDGKMGIINLKNKTVVEFEYENIMPGSDGVFIACKDGVWGVILVGDAVASFKGVNIQTVAAEDPSNPDTQEEGPIGSYKVVSRDGANVRKDAGADYDKVTELAYGDVVAGYTTKTAENGNDWLCIKYEGEYAYVAMSNLEKVESDN